MPKYTNTKLFNKSSKNVNSLIRNGEKIYINNFCIIVGVNSGCFCCCFVANNIFVQNVKLARTRAYTTAYRLIHNTKRT